MHKLSAWLRSLNTRLATGEMKAVEHADHVSIPLCPLGRMIRKLLLTALLS